jgi:hypothetical protein
MFYVARPTDKPVSAFSRRPGAHLDGIARYLRGTSYMNPNEMQELFKMNSLLLEFLLFAG